MIWVILSTGRRRVIDLHRPGRGVVRIYGTQIDDHLDSAVSAGDFNGDGIGDVIIGADAGAFVVLGSRDFGGVDLLHPRHRVVTIDGGAQDLFGQSVASVGDLNHDGLGDVAVGYQGGAVIVFGRHGAGTRFTVDDAGFRGYDIGAGSAHAPSSLGEAVGSIGDVNRDGTSEVVVAAPSATVRGRKYAGAVSIYYGKSNSASQTYPPTPAQGMQVFGAQPGDLAGHAVADLGDITGDGRPELAIGANGASRLGRPGAGATYSISLPVDGSDVDLRNTAAVMRTWIGAHTRDHSGFAVDSIATEGPGRQQVLIGSGETRHKTGAMYIANAR